MDEKAPATCVLRLYGAAEQTVQQALAGLPQNGAVTVQCRSRGAETLVALQGKTAESLRRAVQALRTAFAADLYGEGECDLANAAVQALETHHKLLVCSDATAGALLETRLETVPGAEKVFDFGAMSYADSKTAARIEQKAKASGEADRVLARVQAAQKVVGVELAAGCLEQADRCVLFLGDRKDCWVRCVPKKDNPGLWLLDMLRRAACGLPQAAGTSRLRYGKPVPEVVLQPAEGAAPRPEPPHRKRHGLRKFLLVVVVLAALAFAGSWYYTGGDLAALPQKLQSLGAESTPHAGAKLI